MRMVLCVSLALVALLASAAHAQGDQALNDPIGHVAQRIKDGLLSPLRGSVIDLRAEQDPVVIYVALGAADGIVKDQMLNVVRVRTMEADGRQHEISDEIGTAKVVAVNDPHVCQAAMQTNMAGLTVARGDKAIPQDRKTVPSRMVVGVLLRSGDNVPNQMGQEVADVLGTALTAAGKTVAERQGLDQVLAQQRLTLNDLFDASKVRQIGQLKIADAIVLGRIRDTGNVFVVNATVVDIATGLHIAAATASCAATEQLRKKLQTPAGGGGTPPPPTSLALFSKDRTWVMPGAPSKLETDVMVGGVWWPQAIHIIGKLAIVLRRSVGPTELEVGVSDDPNAWPADQLELLVDGQIVQTVPLRRNRPPTVVKIDLTGADALTFRCTGNQSNAWVRQPGAKIEVPEQ